MPRDPKLDETGIAAALDALPRWTLTGGELVRVIKLSSFPQAVAFVNRVAELAEAADHHPDIDIRYNTLRFGLITHDSGGITQRDVQFATQIDQLFSVPEGAIS